MDKKKEKFIAAYNEAFGNITLASKAADIGRRTYYDWLKNDPEFKAAIEATEPDEIFLDFAENALQKKIAKGDTTAIIFALKTKGKKRGYVERQEITGANGNHLFDNIQINIVDSFTNTGK